MKKAILVKKIRASNPPNPFSPGSDKEIYFLDPPLKVNNNYLAVCADFVYVSMADTFDHGPETMAFECTEEGDVTDWTDIACIRKMDSVDLLEIMGYTIVE